MKVEVEMRFGPVAGAAGLGLVGYAVGGILGAGIALLLPAATFLGIELLSRWQNV